MHKAFAVFRIASVIGITFSLANRAAAQNATGSGGDAAQRASSVAAQPGDRVWLHVWREPKLSDTVSVDEHGEILLPKIGTVKASSMSIAALRDTVRARFAEYLREAPLDLVVLRRVSVNGAVGRPNVYYVDVSTTLRDVIARAGGVTGEGDDGKVSIVRDGRTMAVRDWQSDFSTTSDLRSGDQVIVGRKSWLQQNLVSALSLGTVVASLLITVMRK